MSKLRKNRTFVEFPYLNSGKSSSELIEKFDICHGNYFTAPGQTVVGIPQKR